MRPSSRSIVIAVYGYRWQDQVDRFRQWGAVRVVGRLRLQQAGLQLAIRDSVDELKQARALRLGVKVGRLALEPASGSCPSIHPADEAEKCDGASGDASSWRTTTRPVL